MTTATIVEINGDRYAVAKQSDVIEAPSKKGTKYWQGYVLQSVDNMPFIKAGAFFTATCSWQTTKNGLSKKMWSEPYYAEATNVGQSNERNNWAQAFFELDSMVNKQTDKRMSERPLPMLAHPYQKRAKYIKFPCVVQPKFDGMRVLYNGEEAWSRGNKEIIPEVFAHLQFNTQGYTVDGELILPDNLKVNETMSAAKKFRAGVSDKLLYRVYDIVDADKGYRDRHSILLEMVLDSKNKNVVMAETHQVNHNDEMIQWHTDFTDRGYEGTIIRNLDGKYAINQRSNDLQKYKDFVDAEFEIVDIIPAGGGSSAKVGKFVCVDEKGERFESTATGTEAERTEYLVNKHKYIGKFAKVKYRELSGKNAVPFHSNVLEIRDTKDGGY